MSRTLLWLGAVLTLPVSAASAQDLRYIDPDPRTGSSKAVIVGELPLIHTGQLLPLDAENQIIGKGDARAQVDHVFRSLQTVMGSNASDLKRILKLHFYVANEAVVADIEKALVARFERDEKPAVSFVVTPLPHPDALVAVDAVGAYLPSSNLKAVVRTTIIGLPKSQGVHSAVMPAGARVYIAGQAEKGELLEATRKTMESLSATLKFLGVQPNQIVQVKAFLNPMSRAEEVGREIAKFLREPKAPPLVFVEWQSSLPIEIELIAWAGKERAGEPIEFLTPPGMKASPVYSRVTRINHGGTIYISGQYGSSMNDPSKEVPEIFESLKSLLERAGTDFRHLAKANYYVTSDEATKKMGEIRPKFYDPKRPPAASLAKVAGTGVAGNTVSLDLVAVPSPFKNVNEYGEPEYGHGLTQKEAMDGWISLFDGKTTFGWKNAKVVDGQLVSGTTTISFPGKWWLKSELAQLGELGIGAKRRFRSESLYAPNPRDIDGHITVESGALKYLKLKPVSMTSLFNSTDLAGWQPVNHPKLPEDRRPKWDVKDRFIHAQGGPGALEYTKEPFGDGIIQIEVRTRARITNGGLFFRCVPGQMMNGYEAQIYNRGENGDVSKPSVWSTGAIDDRQNARRLVSRDGEPFVMTVIANGPHIATWVNGYQQVDWTDTRAKHENPRQGLRVEPGPIQLQAHDAGTDIEFRAIRMAKWGK